MTEGSTATVDQPGWSVEGFAAFWSHPDPALRQVDSLGGRLSQPSGRATPYFGSRSLYQAQAPPDER